MVGSPTHVEQPLMYFINSLYKKYITVVSGFLHGGAKTKPMIVPKLVILS